MRVRCRALGCFVAACIVVTAASRVHAQLPHKLVLLLHGGPESFPGNGVFDEAIRQGLYASKTFQIEAYSEYLENEEFGDAAYTSLKEYIRVKFSGRRPDLVIANTAPALQFVLDVRDELFPDVPVVFGTATVPAEILEHKVTGFTGIVRESSLVETVEMALRIHPGTKRLHVIAYAPGLEGYEERMRTTLAPFAKRVAVTFGNEPTLAELLSALKKLPPDTIVLSNRYSPVNTGRIIFPGESIPAISEASTAPNYSTLDTYLGEGVVGGMMRTSTSTARRLTEMALRVLDGDAPDTMPIEPAQVKPIFDWRQLQRWHIAESRLPEGSEIRFRVPNEWEMYGPYIVGTLIVVIAQLLLIGGLMRQRAQLRSADNTIRASEASLRSSYDRIRQMAGRLINAQEAARADIARDLHDDVSQKLAYVSMGVNSLKMAAGNIQDPATQQAFAELENETRSTFDGIRRLSHELHPATLRLLGLAPALRSHCEEVAKRQGLEVKFSAAEHFGAVHPDIAVCFFRIAQESIRNSIAHGGAKHVTVSLTRSGDQVELTVADDGRGFDVNAVKSSGGGLGLVTMEERVNLVGGDVSIVSEAGRGATVRARGPANPAQTTAS